MLCWPLCPHLEPHLKPLTSFHVWITPCPLYLQAFTMLFPVPQIPFPPFLSPSPLLSLSFSALGCLLRGWVRERLGFPISLPSTPNYNGLVARWPSCWTGRPGGQGLCLSCSACVSNVWHAVGACRGCVGVMIVGRGEAEGS